MSNVSTRKPRFNHVAMSLPPDLLDPANRDEIVGFYREVFGWEEIPQMTIDRQRLVLSAYTYEQFVFLIADEPPMECPRLDANRILLNELVVTGAFVYDADGFDRSLELLARPDFPTSLLIEPDDVGLDGLYDAIVGLHDGALAAKVMIVPRGKGKA